MKLSKDCRLPVGFIGTISNDKNTQEQDNIRKGDLFRIVEVTKTCMYNYYTVEFLPIDKYKRLNDKGPFLSNEDIEITEAIKVLYGK